MKLKSVVSLTKIYVNKQGHKILFVGPLFFLILFFRIQHFHSSGRNSIILPLLSGKYASMFFECVKLFGENEYIFEHMAIWVLEI